jgi:hypothetical protein
MLMMAELLHVRPARDDIPCASCEPALAAMLELELDDGSPAALAAYPDVAWHLWTCPDCAELARLTRAMIVAERTGALPLPPPLMAALPQPAPLASFRLPRSFLAVALPHYNTALGVARGDDESQVLYDDTRSGCRLTVLAARTGPDAYAITARMRPPLPAVRLLLRLEPLVWEAAFAGEIAMVVGVPAAALEQADGPELRGEIVAVPPPT